MRKGFTLLELMIVIIIVGVLATLGIMQYQSTIEKSRGAEARSVISTLRSACAAIYLQDQETLQCTTDSLGIDAAGAAAPIIGRVPGGACWGTNYFRYTISTAGVATSPAIGFRAIRCNANGKIPNNVNAAAATHFVDLQVNYATGVDTWSTQGGY